MNILLGVTGSVAAKLTPKLMEELSKIGEVRVILTESARKFLTGEMVKVIYKISNHHTYIDSDEWVDISKVVHIELREWADIFVIAPLTANTLAKMANGLSDNLLTSVFRAWDFNKRIIVAPSMNTKMYESPFTKEHLTKLKNLGIEVVEPVIKTLYCGETGNGAMADIEDICESVKGKWLFPLNACNGIPINHHPGAFGFHRRKNYHTGVDLYTYENCCVNAVECGTVVNIDVFTGPRLGHDWWEETWAVMVEGLTGVVNYGEINPSPNLKIGGKVKRGEYVGAVSRVLFKDKLRKDIPGHSTSMLHLELYKHGTRDFADWHDPAKNPNLLDPTKYLMEADRAPKNILTWDNPENKETVG